MLLLKYLWEPFMFKTMSLPVPVPVLIQINQKILKIFVTAEPIFGIGSFWYRALFKTKPWKILLYLK